MKINQFPINKFTFVELNENGISYELEIQFNNKKKMIEFVQYLSNTIQSKHKGKVDADTFSISPDEKSKLVSLRGIVLLGRTVTHSTPKIHVWKTVLLLNEKIKLKFVFQNKNQEFCYVEIH